MFVATFLLYGGLYQVTFLSRFLFWAVLGTLVEVGGLYFSSWLYPLCLSKLQYGYSKYGL